MSQRTRTIETGTEGTKIEKGEDHVVSPKIIKGLEELLKDGKITDKDRIFVTYQVGSDAQQKAFEAIENIAKANDLKSNDIRGTKTAIRK